VFQAVSYLGVPLMDPAGTDLGHLAVLDSRPMPKEPRLISLFQIFANRAAAEHQRLRAEAATRERETRQTANQGELRCPSIGLIESELFGHEKVGITQKVNGVEVARLFETIAAIKQAPNLADFEFRLGNKWINGARNRSLIANFYGVGQENKHHPEFVLDTDEPPLLQADVPPNVYASSGWLGPGQRLQM